METKNKRKRKTTPVKPVLVYSTTVKHSKQKPLEPKTTNPWSGK